MSSRPEGFEFTKIQVGQNEVYKFQPSTMHILKWLNGFEFLINNIQDHEERLKILFNCLETSVHYEIVQTFKFEDEDVTYDWLISILIKLYSHCQGTQANDMRLIFRFQYPDESVPDYVLALRKLSSKCTPELKYNYYLMKAFLRGLRDKEIKALLMKEKDLTLGRAVYIARHQELSVKARI